MFEEEIIGDRISEEMRQEPAAPPLGGLVADALADGVRMRRTRRIGQVFAGVAGVTAVAAGAVGVSAGIGHSGTQQSTASGSSSTGTLGAASSTTPTAAATPSASPTKPGGGPSATSSAPASATPTVPGAKPTNGTPPPTQQLVRNWQMPPSWMAAPQTPVKPADAVPVTGQSMVLQLEKLLTSVSPGGTFTHTSGSGVGPQNLAGTDLFWKNSTIAVRVSEPGKGFAVGCLPAQAGHSADPCTDYKLPDGSEVNVWDNRPDASTGDRKSLKDTQYVTINRPDGVQIMIFETNGPETGGRGPDRSDLPMTVQQLYTIASDAHWNVTADRAFAAQAASQITLQEVF